MSGVIFLGVSAAGCSSAGEQTRSERIQQQIDDEAELSSESQQAVLEDGDVTFLEYEAAVYSTIECLEAEGLVVDGPHEDLANPGQLVFGYGGTETVEELDAVEPIYNRCYSEHLSVINQAYAFASRLSPEDEEARDLLIGECMADFGVVGADVGSIDELRQTFQRFPVEHYECLIKINTEDGS